MWYFQEVYESKVHRRRNLAVNVIFSRPRPSQPVLQTSRSRINERQSR
jgi:hypothetical protein